MMVDTFSQGAVALTDDPTQASHYARLFESQIEAGHSTTDTAALIADVYLDGKPRQRGKRKLTWGERDAVFWSSEFLCTLPAEAWQTESMVLALARYMGQERTANPALLEHIASIAPESVKRAVRYSGLVLQPSPVRRAEIEVLASIAPDTFGDFVCVLKTFDTAYHERLVDVEMRQSPLAELSPLELLAYASLYAFEHWVPRDLLSTSQPDDPDAHTQSIWEAINDIFIWKLRCADDDACRFTERDIAMSLRIHLSPFLFPSPDGSEPREDLYRAFGELLGAQIELNSFVTRSADAFSFDDSIEFVLQDGTLAIVTRDPAARVAWARNGDKLARLHNYWLYRGVNEFATSELATATIGRSENHEANRFAYIYAIRTYLRLTEVYGLTDSVATESGRRVNLFQALLSLEMMSAFFKQGYMLPFLGHLTETGDPRRALSRLAFGGLLQPDMQNRFPITWSDRAAKIAKITGWTVTPDFPDGSAKAAEAILDFWTIDWADLSARLRKGETGLQPALFERPILKMGRYLFQLPWVVATQNNSTAAINNLRRLGARRPEAGVETRRIEERLAKLFEHRGFCVVLNYEPTRTDEDDPGEVDLICARDGQVLIMEVKSTFLRRSQREAWLHGTTALRKAGIQLSRKIKAIEKVLISDEGLASTLGIEPHAPPTIRGWIVDTSIEHDHERFSGYLKVSLEEVIIALRDDSHLLNDPVGVFGDTSQLNESFQPPDAEASQTLYPDAFSISRFIEIIESEAVWDELSRES